MKPVMSLKTITHEITGQIRIINNHFKCHFKQFCCFGVVNKNQILILISNDA